MHVALTIGPCPLADLPEDLLRRSWDAARSYLLADTLPERLWGWRHFERTPPEPRPELRRIDQDPTTRST